MDLCITGAHSFEKKYWMTISSQNAKKGHNKSNLSIMTSCTEPALTFWISEVK